MNKHASRRTILRHLAIGAICGGMTQLASPAESQCDSQSDHRAWVEQSLERMLTIQPGVTRNELMKVFTTEGGLSTAMQRTFVSRDCPYFKVNVGFRRAVENDKQTDWLPELADDVITTISEPYLQFSIMD